MPDQLNNGVDAKTLRQRAFFLTLKAKLLMNEAAALTKQAEDLDHKRTSAAEVIYAITAES